MNDFVKLIREYEDKTYKNFTGMFSIKEELSDEVFNALIDGIGAGSRWSRLLVIDTKLREAGIDMNCVVCNSAFDMTSERTSFYQEEVGGIMVNKVHKSKVCILEIKPEYIIYRELVSKDNIAHIFRLYERGYHTITFTNLTKEELIDLYISIEPEMNPQYVERVFEDINLIQ